MEPDPYKHIRKQIPPPDYEIKDKRRYDKADRYTNNIEINKGLEEYYEEYIINN